MPLPDETIAWLRQAARLGQAGALADLDALARLDALEARVALLEATQHAHIEGPIDPSTLESLRKPASIQRLEPMEPAASATATAAAPVVEVEACLVDQIRRHAPTMNITTAEAILYEVAAWLDRRGNHGPANELREQCAASQEERANG